MDQSYLLLIIFGYLSGSIATAVIVCRLLTLPDPRIVGSLNPGATNVLRIGGRKAAICTLLGDVLKTLLPLYIARYMGYDSQDIAWLAVFSLLGHCFPIYFSFKGGKGVASMLSAIVFVAPQLSLLAIASWVISILSYRRASVASLIVAVIVPLFAYRYFNELFVPLSALSAVVCIRHRKNIANIIQAKEPEISVGQIERLS